MAGLGSTDVIRPFDPCVTGFGKGRRLRPRKWC